MNQIKLQKNHYPELDGLRGIAILLVLLSHNFGYITLLSYGWIGVDLFFVLSGFLITDILLKSFGEKNYLLNFYIRRGLRIFPIYYLCLFLLLVVFPFFKISTSDYNFNISHQLWYWTYTQNWLMVKYTYAGAYSMIAFWTLAAEEQFYLTWPLIILLVKNKKHLFILLLGILLALNLFRIYLSVSDNAWASENTFNFSRFDGLLVGCLHAISKSGINKKLLFKSWLSIILILNTVAFLLWMIDIPVLYWGFAGYTTISIIFGFIISICTQEKNKSLPFINWPLLKQAGKYSYGLYVFHWSVYSLLHPYTEKWFWPAFYNRIPESLFLLLIEIAVAVLIYHIFEKHFLKLKKYFYSAQPIVASPQPA